MTFAELICRLARRRFEEGTALGVRFSPLNIDVAGAKELHQTVRDFFGETVYLAVAVPGLEAFDDAHTCLSSGERAAVRATEWRNQIRPESGQHILYVSVERQGRAGGLQDTLVALDEAALRAEARSWCGEATCSLPPTLAAALVEMGVDRVDVRDFCAFTRAMAGKGIGEAGALLPLLHLLPDRKLTDDPAKRLAANLTWVRWASEGADRSSSRLSPAAQAFRKELKEALTAGRPIEATLRRFDLGGFATAELEAGAITKTTRAPALKLGAVTGGRAGEPATKAAPTVRPSAFVGTTGKTTSGTLTPLPVPAGRSSVVQTTAIPEAGSPAAAPAQVGSPAPPGFPTSAPSLKAIQTDGAPAVPAIEAPALSTGPAPVGSTAPPPESAAPASSSGAAPPAATAPPLSTARPAPRRDESSDDREPEPPRPKPLPKEKSRDPEGPWTSALQAAELGDGPTLAPGLLQLLDRLQAAPGQVYGWSFRGGSLRAVLTKPPKHLPDPQVQAIPKGLAPLMEAWLAARAGLCARIATSRPLEELLRAPAVVLGRPKVQEAVDALMDAWDALLGAAVPEDLGLVLALDSVRLTEEGSGRRLVLLSPLHPVWLGAWLLRASHYTKAAKEEGLWRRVILEAWSGPLFAPLRWPAEPPLPRQPDLYGLVVYGTEAVGPDAELLRGCALALSRRLLELHPYLQRGVRVVVEAPQPGPVVEGLLQGCGEAQAPLTVLCAGAVGGDGVQEALKAGRLRLEALPLDRRTTRASVWFRSCERRPPGAPEGRGGSRPHRSLGEPLASTLEAGSFRCGPALSAGIERLSGQAAQWVAGEGAVKLEEVAGEEVEKAAWRVVVASALSGRPPRGGVSLIREELGEVELVALSADERAASSFLAGAYRRLGVQDERPSRLALLTRALGQGGGLLSLEGPSERRIGAQLLDLLLREQTPGVAVAPLTGSLRRLFVGEDPDPEGYWSLAAGWEGRVQLRLGYVALERGLSMQRSATGWEGALVHALSRVAGLLRKAGEGDYLAGNLRELLCRILWRSLAAEDAAPKLTSALLGDAAMEVDLQILCLLPADLVAATAGVPLKVDGVGVKVVGADERVLERLVGGRGRR